MYTLHIANKTYSSWSLRPWVLMKTLNIDFIEKMHPFPDPSLPNPYYDFSPTGKVPCLHDGELMIWDSLAIVEYLAERHQQVWPSSSTARAWGRSAVCEIHSGFNALRNHCSMHLAVSIQLPSITADLQADLDRLERLWLEGINKFSGPFLTGEYFTAVDAFYLPVAFRLQTYNLHLSPAAMDYAHLLLELNAAKEWQAAARQEIWRETLHDQEIFATGKIINDFRISA